MVARQLSEEAIKEFSDAADIARQWQYRCQLETAAGQFSTARDCLSKGLQLVDSSHRAIASAIRGIAADNPGAEGFPLLHWLRLGTAAVLAGNVQERDAFLQTAEEAALLGSAWATDGVQNYPAHGIIRRVAVLHAYRNRKRMALEVLDVLRRGLNPTARRQVSLALVQVAAEAEVAAVFFPVDPQAAVGVLGASGRGGEGLLRTLEQTVALTNGKVPGIHALLNRWIEQVQQIVIGKVSPAEAGKRLLSLASGIDF